EWPAPPGVHALVTLRGPAGGSAPPFDRFDMGLRNGDDVAVVARNRGLLQQGLTLPSPPAWLRQVHGTTVVVEPDAADEAEADAAITRTAGRVLAILTADCLPVVFAARDGSEIGAAHAGWRGLCAGVLEATVAAMHAAPGDILAWLGPAAGPGAYEIGVEVHDAFLAEDGSAASAFVATRPGHWRVDLYALARQRLLAAGLRADAIHGGGLCTISDPARFYSHRRDQRTGRMATLAWRQAAASADR
nr:peptidoglycan editing factor PgeF [Pseudomonadota bacterium]